MDDREVWNTAEMCVPDEHRELPGLALRPAYRPTGWGRVRGILRGLEKGAF